MKLSVWQVQGHFAVEMWINITSVCLSAHIEQFTKLQFVQFTKSANSWFERFYSSKLRTGRLVKFKSFKLRKMTSWHCLTCWPVKLWCCKMMSLVNKSADWTSNYHKILIFSPTKYLKSLRAVRIDEISRSERIPHAGSYWLFVMVFSPFKLKVTYCL